MEDEKQMNEMTRQLEMAWKRGRDFGIGIASLVSIILYVALLAVLIIK